MKLADLLTIRLSALSLLIMLVWSVIYFFMQMHEIYDDIDEGLTNLKQEFIVQANDDANFVEAMEKYNPFNMIVKEIRYDEAIEIKEKHSTTEVYFETEKEYEEVRILNSAFRCENNGKYYSITFFTSTVESNDLIENMLILLIALWLTLGISIIIVGKRVIHNSSKPFRRLLASLQEFSLNHTQMIEFPKTKITEFKALNNAVEILLDENIKAYKEQKKFIENASHELQTPLTIVIGRMEMMTNRVDVNEQQMKEFGTILANLNRMKRLNSSLLLLSKIRNKQFIENSNLNFRDIVEEVAENFKDIIDHKSLSLHLNIEKSPIVNMNEDLAHILVSNLMKNAVNYNLPNGNINITLTADSFTIANDGKPIPNNTNIFERYTSESSHNASIGLGLSIVSTIISVYNFRIKHIYNNQHQFVINFK